MITKHSRLAILDLNFLKFILVLCCNSQQRKESKTAAGSRQLSSSTALWLHVSLKSFWETQWSREPSNILCTCRWTNRHMYVCIHTQVHVCTHANMDLLWWNSSGSFSLIRLKFVRKSVALCFFSDIISLKHYLGSIYYLVSPEIRIPFSQNSRIIQQTQLHIISGSTFTTSERIICIIYLFLLTMSKR